LGEPPASARSNPAPGRNPHKGRWPANLLLDEEAAAMLDEQSGNLIGNKGIKGVFKGQRHNGQFAGGGISGDRQYDFCGYHDFGGASRFFYCAKTSSRERNEGLENLPDKGGRPLGISNWDGQTNGSGKIMEKSAPQKNHHPTVKPLALMRYLITLISPPTNALILDPFAGSGSTIVAAEQLHIKAIGIEKQPEYVEIARARVLHAAKKANEVAEQMTLI
jgi:site-specific DNA-methyltransferase (adenine-specific)